MKTQLVCLDGKLTDRYRSVYAICDHTINLKNGASKASKCLPHKNLLWCSVYHHIGQIQNIVIQRIPLMTQKSLTYHWVDKCTVYSRLIRQTYMYMYNVYNYINVLNSLNTLYRKTFTFSQSLKCLTSITET